jgi:spore photoproduct lyase
VKRFARQNFRVLELKTKTARVDSLAGLDHNRKTICAWSLNTPKVISIQERGTASLDARLSAAAQCQSMGYPVAFHFDPLFVGNEQDDEEYREVVRKIFQKIHPENIVWISLGAFRFIPSLKPLIQDRFPDSKIIYGEFVKGLDAKFRYFSPLRIRLYEKIASWIREYDPDACIYLCMENDKVWQKALGFLPKEKGGLWAMLDRRAAQICGLDIQRARPRPDLRANCL